MKKIKFQIGDWVETNYGTGYIQNIDTYKGDTKYNVVHTDGEDYLWGAEDITLLCKKENANYDKFFNKVAELVSKVNNGVIDTFKFYEQMEFITPSDEVLPEED